jgi:hypothetical protein
MPPPPILNRIPLVTVLLPFTRPAHGRDAPHYYASIYRRQRRPTNARLLSHRSAQVLGSGMMCFESR